MYSEEFKEISYEHQLFDNILFDDVIGNEEMKMNSLEKDLQSLEKKQMKNLGRGKGRPKGEKNSKNPEKRKKENFGKQNFQKGHWLVEENKKYHWFLEIYHQHFICKEMRRLDKIFKSMANFIGTREAEQCRSHHQKMEKKHLSFPNILLHLRTLHYTTNETFAVLEDMKSKQINDINGLLSVKELENIMTQKVVPITPTLPEMEEEPRQQDYLINREISFNICEPSKDIFRDNYEEQLEIENLLF